MTKYNFLLLTMFYITLIFFTGCREQTGSKADDEPQYGSALIDPAEKAFFNNLAQYCGWSFSGEQVFMAEGRESWAHMEFIMHVTVCEDNRIYVPFHLDDDHSRTWMFLVEDGRLRFRHDHRHDDGTPEEITMYGGYGNGKGTALMQDFPADDYTCELIPTSCDAVWRVELSEDLRSYSYMLLYHDELLFHARFDLENPVAQ